MPLLGWQARVTPAELALGQASDILLLLVNTVLLIHNGFKAYILDKSYFFFWIFCFLIFFLV